jgi:DNA modification methylase
MQEQHDICLPGFFSYLTLNSRDGKNHIAEKPEKLMADILGITSVGAIVLDPFMGVGSTGLACLNLGRNFIGIEREPKYFAIAERRVRDAAAQTLLPFDAALERDK